MGFYPKHLRRRAFKRNMRLIATAALSGCTFNKVAGREPINAYNYNGDQLYTFVDRWGIIYADGQQSVSFGTKGAAAATYLMWWFQKQNMWPRYRV